MFGNSLAVLAQAAPSSAHLFWGEVVGTGVLILLGDGVVAGVLLSKSKAHSGSQIAGEGGGWMVITWAWAMGVVFGVYTSAAVGGLGHLNPAVTIALAATDKMGPGLGWSDVPTLIAGEFVGAFAGALLVYLAYLAHWEQTEDPGLKLAVYCTAPAIRNYPANVITEIIGTAMLVLGVVSLSSIPGGFTAGFVPFVVGLLVFAIGMSLGGPTGYAINPARDLGPRIMHFVLPIAGKGSSDWAYSWVPVVGPIIGGVLGAYLGKAVFLS